MVLKRNENDKWCIVVIIFDHNHELIPGRIRVACRNREILLHIRKQLEMHDQANVPLQNSINYAIVQGGEYGNCKYTNKQLRNFLAHERKLKIKAGDAEALMSFLDRKQAECPNFFCTVAINKNYNLLNVFWPYARSKADHQLFGDIVTFDTTYLTNKYKMPFSPIVGVNNFGQSILFGCALLSGEIIDTYEWLFNKWLVCFTGKAPDAIIIDQCQSICGAIERVFPKSRHRLCAWHILGKVTKKVGGISGKHAISTKVSNVVYESETEYEFENR
ncbi:hypothetical protein LUZ60_010298 [Juncus effusus]|nr:hypothetical protein LUZ60_010298 [Juncus effusus]